MWCAKCVIRAARCSMEWDSLLGESGVACTRERRACRAVGRAETLVRGGGRPGRGPAACRAAGASPRGLTGDVSLLRSEGERALIPRATP